MAYRITNTTRKPNPRTARERVGTVVGIGDKIVLPLKSMTISNELYLQHQQWLLERVAAGIISILPVGVTAEERKDFEVQVVAERELAQQRQAAVVAEPVVTPKPVLEDPNSEDLYDGVPTSEDTGVSPDMFRGEAPVHGAKSHGKGGKKTTAEV